MGAATCGPSPPPNGLPNGLEPAPAAPCGTNPDETGCAKGCEPGGANGCEPGGANGCDPGGANGCEPGGGANEPGPKPPAGMEGAWKPCSVPLGMGRGA